MDELYLAYEYEVKKQEEKEELREAREREKEEKKRQKELEKEKKKFTRENDKINLYSRTVSGYTMLFRAASRVRILSRL